MQPFAPFRLVTKFISWVQRSDKGKPLLRRAKPKFETLSASQKFEEETFDNFEGRYCPVIIGQVLDTRYEVVGKLGFGLGSTVWLARDHR